MSLMLTPGQIVVALKRAGHPAADDFERELIEFTLRVVGQLCMVEPSVHAPFAHSANLLSWPDEILVGIHPVDEALYDEPPPECLRGLDDEGWVD